MDNMALGSRHSPGSAQTPGAGCAPQKVPHAGESHGCPALPGADGASGAAHCTRCQAPFPPVSMVGHSSLASPGGNKSALSGGWARAGGGL